MRRAVLLSVCLTLLPACHRNNNPVAPSGSTPVGQTMLTFGLAVKRAPNSYSLKIAGTTSSDDLIQSLPLERPLKASESWSGSKMILREWTTQTKIYTNDVFLPPAKDHYTFDDVPSTGSVDITLEIQPGGVTDSTVINVVPDSQHVGTSPGGYTFSKQSDGRVHIKGSVPK